MHEEADEIIQAIVIITAIFTIVALFVIIYVLFFNNRKNKLIAENELLKKEFEAQLLESKYEAREEALTFLSKELHDNVGQLLNSAKLMIGLTERNLKNPPDALITAHQTLGSAIAELREIAKVLNKDWLLQFNLLDNLKLESERINKSKTCNIKLNIISEINISNEKQLILFRLIQECLQNALKHASANTIIINFKEENNHLLVFIADDGIGIKPKDFNDGLGMMNMKQRIKILNGEINVGNNKPVGTFIRLKIPV